MSVAYPFRWKIGDRVKEAHNSKSASGDAFEPRDGVIHALELTERKTVAVVKTPHGLFRCLESALRPL